MDGSRFDAWTRRGFGFAAAGGLASVLGIAALDDAAAKKKRRNKKRKKRCTKLGQPCQPGGRKCCHGRMCGANNNVTLHCCKNTGSCSHHHQCCSGICNDITKTCNTA